ncbi:MAG: addiction module antidote protein [Tardiphaga sp.]
MTVTALFDAVEYLDSPDVIAAYLTAAFEEGDPALIVKAIDDVVRTQGVNDVAEKAGLSRENLPHPLGGDAKPEFATVLKLLHALGISLVAQTRVA